MAAALAGVFVFAATPDAGAVASLRISDGTTTIVIADGSGIDGDSDTGVIVYNAPNGTFANWTISVSTGLTKPAFGLSNLPMMELNFVALYNNAGAAGSLTIDFTDTAFTGPTPASFGAKYGGNIATGATLTYTTYRDNANNAFADGADNDSNGSLPVVNTTTPGTGQPDAANLMTNSGTLTDLQSSFLWTAALTNSNPYSLTQRIAITQAAGSFRTTSGDATLFTPDGGMTAALLGFTFLGIAGLRRKFATA